MSIVAPNGQVRLLANVPLDSNFENTLYFATELEQRTYFLGLTPVHTMSNATRVRNGVIAVDVLEDTIRNCNYLMFQNQNFSNKWFYAFITGTEYVNNGTTYVSYMIDDIQTYLMSGTVTLLECMIDRQHTTTDAINGNLIPEDIGAPEMTMVSALSDTSSNTQYGFSGNMTAVLFADTHLDAAPDPEDPDEWKVNDFKCVSGLLTQIAPVIGAEYMHGGEITSAYWTVMEALVKSLIEDNKSSSIVGGVCMPSEFCIADFSVNSKAKETDIGISKSQLYTTLDGYTPVNKKLYTSPYMCVRFQMSDGQCIFLQPQWISGDFVQWKEICTTSMTPELLVVPKNYKGQTLAYSESLSFDKFPQIGFAVDGYKAWVAAGGLASAELTLQQTKESGHLQMASNAWNTFSGAREGISENIKGSANIIASAANLGSNPSQAIGGIMGGSNQAIAGRRQAENSIVGGIFNQAKIQQSIKFANENFDLQHSIAKTFPPSLRGNSVGGALGSAYKIGYKVEKMSINAQQAKAIDNYFTMYGYKLNELAVPNMHARPHYTYVKTVGCKVNGGAPDESIVNIENIFDNGIRFWVNASEVGKYNEVDNRPVTPTPSN